MSPTSLQNRTDTEDRVPYEHPLWGMSAQDRTSVPYEHPAAPAAYLNHQKPEANPIWTLGPPRAKTEVPCYGTAFEDKTDFVSNRGWLSSKPDQLTIIVRSMPPPRAPGTGNTRSTTDHKQDKPVAGIRATSHPSLYATPLCMQYGLFEVVPDRTTGSRLRRDSL